MIKNLIVHSVLATGIASTAANAASIIIDTIPGNNRATMSQIAGQTFTTGVLASDANLLSEIRILGDSGGTANAATVSAQLWVDTDQDFGTWDPGTLVATSTNSQVISAADTVFTFNFSNQALSNNTVYALSFTDGTNSHVSFRSDVTNEAGVALTDGALFSAGVQPFGGAFDASIEVVAVPETSMLGLIAIAGFGFLRRRR